MPTNSRREPRDLAFGLEFVHEQDRFFQMDGLRRYVAGELAEILGTGPGGSVVAMDRRVRVLRFRAVAREVVANLGASERRHPDAYVRGVHAGLGSLRARPFEDLPLRESPRPWVAEDSVLVIRSLCIDLQANNIAEGVGSRCPADANF